MDLPENELRGYIEDNGKPMWKAHNNHNIRHFKEEDIRIITNNYETLLGKGAFGEVYKGVLDDNSSVAVKRYIHNVKEDFAKEVIVHCQINHRNVVRLIGCCIGENALMMVTEYISKGSLSDILHCSEISISLETRLDIAIGCAEALNYMHRQMYGKVIHGDIKPANILLDENLNAKISDFGLSKLLSTDNTLYTTQVLGSIGYMDPLFVQSGRLTSKSDVYSFGIVLLELITRRKAVDGDKINHILIENFAQALEKRKKIREFYDVKVADENNLRILDGIGKLAAKCLAMDLKKRPEMKDVAESLRMFRKAQYQSQEKMLLFGWVRRSKQPPKNMVPADKHFHENQVLKAEVQAQKEIEVDRDVYNVTVVSEGSPRLYSFGSSQGIELEKLSEAPAEVLGKGKYATTYKTVLHEGSILTVKRLKTVDLPDVPEALFKERIAAIGTIEHELIVPLRQYYYSKDRKLLVYDYFSNGSLASNLHGMAPVGWETRSAIALSVARAVAYIHSINAPAVSHGNLSCSNILLTGSYEARVSEHGLKTLVSAPTLVVDSNITQKDDVYRFGIILLEMLTGKSPILTDEPDLLDWVLSIPHEDWVAKAFDKKLLTKNTVVEELIQFLKLAIHCCDKNLTLRPPMSEVAQQIEGIKYFCNWGYTSTKTMFRDSPIFLQGPLYQESSPKVVSETAQDSLEEIDFWTQLHDTDVYDDTVVSEGSPRLYSFGSSQGIELEKLSEAPFEVLGKGKYATTYMTVLHEGSTLTVKRLETADLPDVPEALFKERIAAIGTIEHELVVPLRQYYYSKDEKLLVYDYFPNGSLASNLHGRNMVPVGWETRSAIALYVARAVAYIHSINSAAASHGNLNCSNILLTGSYEARVSEHGLKTLVSAPTLVVDNTITQKDDVYSFGVILLEMLTGKSPILTDETDLLDWVLSIPREHWVAQAFDKNLLTKNTVVEELVQFLKLAIHCCDKNLTLRPPMSEVAQQIEGIKYFYNWGYTSMKTMFRDSPIFLQGPLYQELSPKVVSEMAQDSPEEIDFWTQLPACGIC